MMRMGNETVEQMDSGLAINRHADNLRIQRQAYKARLRQRYRAVQSKTLLQALTHFDGINGVGVAADDHDW